MYVWRKRLFYLIADYWIGLKLANLHSMAVDYVKTGQPAELTSDLKPPKWPHFMEKVGKKQHQIYTSKKVLGQLYDQVERIDFVPSFTAPFDTRILQAYILDENILRSAHEIKKEYDAHMRRIMAQQEIKTEFEVWSTFVLQHSSTSNDFKYHEQIGEISMALKDQFRLICHQRAGGKDYKHIGPFAAAMYEVTATEVTAAVEECHRVQMVGGQPRPLREMTTSTMPLMSFPWLFQDVLGKIAKSNTSGSLDTMSIRGEIHSEAGIRADGIKAPQSKRGRVGPSRLDSDDYLETSKGTTHPGELLELFGRSSESCERQGPVEAEYVPSSSVSVKSLNSSMGTSAEQGFSANDGLIDHSSSSSPELLVRKPHEDYPDNGGVAVEKKPKSTSRLVSSLRRSVSPEVAGLVGKEQTTALNEACLEQVSGSDQPLGGEPDHTIPEGSNLRLLNDPMMGLAARLDEPKDPGLESSQNGEKKKKKKIGELEKNHDANDEVGYSSDSDTGSEDVVIPASTKAGLLDQLATIARDVSASAASATSGSPTAIQASTAPKLNDRNFDLE